MRFFRPSDLFAVNPSARYERRQVGREKARIVVVDDFYKRPERVRELAREVPAAIWPGRPGSRNLVDYADARQHLVMRYGMESVTATLARLVWENYRVRVSVEKAFVTNVFQLRRPQPPGSINFPHQDLCKDARELRRRRLPASFVLLVYLNPARECHGGTAFFRHIATGRESLPVSPRAAGRFLEEVFGHPANNDAGGMTYWHRTYQEHWERHTLAEMKANRLIVFPAQMFHAAWHEPGWYASCPRITQAFFTHPARA